ncbi:hypothetical protein [Peribacillus sp. SCS-155]|uniref:hypothetical protein n=1 Tax=Peribacillus sedimenti TaxID=3115297 RepID=UPI00390613F1
MKTPFSQIVDLSSIGGPNPNTLNHLYKFANEEVMSPSSSDQQKVLFLGIDIQNDFMEGGELAVPNSHKDVKNITQFLYKNLEKITTIAVSLDTHTPLQIFHPIWWIDRDGNHPEPFTIISEEDVRKGTWRAVEKQEESLEYIHQLEQLGRMQLCIWPLHCIEGTHGAALEAQFSNLIHFHSLARKSPIHKIVKGKDPLSEMYGIIKPEFDRNNYVNLEFLELLMNFDKILIAGQAKSHCVSESLRQILEHFEDQKEVTSKIYILNDCMSPIAGFEQESEKRFQEYQDQYGINIVNSTEFSL